VRKDFSSVFTPGEWRVFGYRLQPLSAAHILHLCAAENPIPAGQPVDSASLLYASKTCSRPIVANKGLWSPKPFTSSMRDSARAGWASTRKTYFEKQAKEFAGYWRAYQFTPEKMQEQGIPKTVSAPGVLAIVAHMIPKVGEARAWSMPFNALVLLSEMQAEIEVGGIRFAADSEEEDSILAALKMAEQKGRKMMAEMEEKHG